MKTITKLTISVLLVLGLGAGAAWAQSVDEAKALVENKINDVLATLDAANKQGLNENQKIKKLEGMIFEVFDMTEMSKRALGVNYNKFNDAQKKEFENLFAEMLEDIYLGNIVTAYSDQKVIFGKTVVLKENEAVEIQSEIIFSDGKKTPIFYRLSNKSGQWLAYDVIIEGISFIKNYRDQFKELLGNNTPDGLLAKMRQKNAEFDAGK